MVYIRILKYRIIHRPAQTKIADLEDGRHRVLSAVCVPDQDYKHEQHRSQYVSPIGHLKPCIYGGIREEQQYYFEGQGQSEQNSIQALAGSTQGPARAAPRPCLGRTGPPPAAPAPSCRPRASSGSSAASTLLCMP